MRRSRWMSLLALALVGCHMPAAPMAPLGSIARDVPPDGEDYRGGSTYRVLAAEELPIVAVAVDSEAAGFGRARLADGDRATQWVNGGYRNPTSWAAVQLAAGADLAAVSLKTGAMPAGTAFDVEVSDDGQTWRPALTGQRVATWNVETLALPAGTTGQWVRLNWRNDPAQPQAHFAVYELSVLGAPQAAPLPSPTPSVEPSPQPSAEPTATPSAEPTPVTESPTPAPTATPTPLPPVTGPVERLTPRTVTANSAYAGLSPGRAIDGDQATQWANGGYQDAEAWVSLDFDQPVRFERIALKTGTQPAGVRYQLESSSDGATWTPLGMPLSNTTWGMETKAAPGEGRHLRIRFLNAPTAPVARFYLFELEVYGHRPVAATPTPTIAPTAEPTPVATATPEVPPSPEPSLAPTPEPIASPTPAPEPTVAPTPPGSMLGTTGPARKLSVPGRAIASSGNALAAADGDPGTYWSPNGGLPQWIAVPLEAPAAGSVFVVWDSTGYTYQNVGAAPRDYVVYTSADSTDGRNGTWYEALSVTGNQVRSRVDAIGAAGARWVRLQTRSVGSYGPQLRRLEVFEAAGTPRQDGWLLLGDSITAQSFHPGRTTLFAATVSALAPGYAPFAIGAGTGGDTAAEGQVRLAAALSGWPSGTYVGLAFGTNDATRGVPVTTFKSRMEQMARSILAAGCTPVIARIPYNKNGNLPAYVGAIDALTAELNLPPGPDLHSWFRAHPEELSSDTVHPNAQGEASIQRLWGEAAVRAYRWGP